MRLLERATSPHISFDTIWYLLVLRIQTLHCLVLSLFGTVLNGLDLIGILGFVFVQLSDFARLLLIDLLNCLLTARSVHVLIDGLTMGERHLLAQCQLHLLLANLLEEVYFLGDRCTLIMGEISGFLNTEILLITCQQIIHGLIFSAICSSCICGSCGTFISHHGILSSSRLVFLFFLSLILLARRDHLL